jgi:hypothetical protein
MAVRLERAHAQRLGQGQGLTVGGCGSLGLRGMVVRIDLTEEPQGPGLIYASLSQTWTLPLMIPMASVETFCSSSGRASDTRPART